MFEASSATRIREAEDIIAAEPRPRVSSIPEDFFCFAEYELRPKAILTRAIGHLLMDYPKLNIVDTYAIQTIQDIRRQFDAA